MIPLFLPSGIENCTPSSLLTDVGAEVTSSNLSAALLHLISLLVLTGQVLYSCWPYFNHRELISKHKFNTVINKVGNPLVSKRRVF